MKKFIPVLLSVACLLALVGDAQAFLFRSRSSVVVKQQNVVVRQQVVKQRVVVQEVQQVKVQKVVVQPVQAVVVQPVQAYYRVESFSSGYGYGTQAFSSGYNCGGTSANSARIRALEREVEALRIQRLEEEKQRLVMPPAR